MENALLVQILKWVHKAGVISAESWQRTSVHLKKMNSLMPAQWEDITGLLHVPKHGTGGSTGRVRLETNAIVRSAQSRGFITLKSYDGNPQDQVDWKLPAPAKHELYLKMYHFKHAFFFFSCLYVWAHPSLKQATSSPFSFLFRLHFWFAFYCPLLTQFSSFSFPASLWAAVIKAK